VTSGWISAVAAAAAIALAGCKSGYTWTQPVPEAKRTVSVPTFRNESDVTEFGSIAARQVLREFQREGTFRLKTNGDAAVEVQGIVKSVKTSVSGYDRRAGMRISSHTATAEAIVSVIDKTSGEVLLDNRRFVGKASFAAREDFMTALRDASGALADDLARQVVDAVLNLKW
jgi:hypothetical protein